MVWLGVIYTNTNMTGPYVAEGARVGGAHCCQETNDAQSVKSGVHERAVTSLPQYKRRDCNGKRNNILNYTEVRSTFGSYV